jgi:hypothetical protein
MLFEELFEEQQHGLLPPGARAVGRVTSESILAGFDPAAARGLPPLSLEGMLFDRILWLLFRPAYLRTR